MKRVLLFAFATTMFLSSCGGGGAEQSTTEPAEETPQVEATEEATETRDPLSDTLLVVIEADDQMKYNMKRINAMAGQTIILTLKNVGEQPKETMGHNWTLLDKGVDFQDFAMAAIAAKDNDYLPADRMADVLAHTSLLGPGEEETIQFTAPDAAGPYKFLCTFPGHFGSMQGILFVME